MDMREPDSSFTVYMAKLKDYLKGVENGNDTYYSRSRQVSKAL